MRTEYKVFNLLALFLYLASALYWWWSAKYLGASDMVGVVALALSGTLTLMMGGYFWFVARRIDPRPEDRDDAEIVDGAGAIGFFSPGSYWPFGIAVASLVTALGLVWFYAWMIGAGVVFLLLTTGGLLFEYYTGARRGAH